MAVLRLVVSATNDLVYGSAVNPETESAHRFSGWFGLEGALREVIVESVGRHAADVASVKDEEA